RFVEPARGALPGTVFPRSLPRRPQRRVDRPRVGGIDLQGDGAGIFILVEDFFPRLAAVGGAKHAALGVGAIRMPEHRDEDSVRIARINLNGGHLVPVAQAHVLPRLAAAGGFVDAPAAPEVAALEPLSAAD